MKTEVQTAKDIFSELDEEIINDPNSIIENEKAMEERES